MSEQTKTLRAEGIGRNFSLERLISDWAAIIAVIILLLIFSIAMPKNFPTWDNCITILRAIAINAVLGMGLTLTLAAGGFDLSAGCLATFSAFLAMSLCVWYGTSPWISMGYAICGSILVTMISMLLIVKFKIPDLLATLAMMFFLQGLSLIYSGGGAVSAGMPRPGGAPSTGSVPALLKNIGQAPTIIIIMLACVAIVHIFLNYTKYGRYIYAVGGNKTATRLSGINVKKYRILAGVMAAVFIALAGILVASRNLSAQINGADGYQMPALSAVFIGRSVAGQGKPNAIGTLVGATLVGILENGLIMIGVPYYAMNAVKGAVLALALASAYYSSKED